MVCAANGVGLIISQVNLTITSPASHPTVRQMYLVNATGGDVLLGWLQEYIKHIKYVKKQNQQIT
jgi:hypothetical protein